MNSASVPFCCFCCWKLVFVTWFVSLLFICGDCCCCWFRDVFIEKTFRLSLLLLLFSPPPPPTLLSLGIQFQNKSKREREKIKYKNETTTKNRKQNFFLLLNMSKIRGQTPHLITNSVWNLNSTTQREKQRKATKNFKIRTHKHTKPWFVS
jgi:hypothetical protein